MGLLLIPDYRVMALRKKKDAAYQVERTPLEICMADYSYQRTQSISVFLQKNKVFKGDLPMAGRGRRNRVLMNMNSDTSEGEELRVESNLK